ncbi:Maltose/maltodextrin transport ATP-binding protein malK [Shigella dysenteriae WRSd3]|uniref:Maltose/maltodextrin transport ATP-binding protein malK n=3 Tax=Enterobacteriaceae TaxID=543 RepID=A0A090NI20_SHIDY|nr:Maltose/maltodextrin transport ATP-binding protein malK [Shigella dysenteriae WRSd3]ESU84579.1 Maltose/maltodextrin transport ATP-binding protein malK [Shigella dysenteriae WRSd5]
MEDLSHLLMTHSQPIMNVAVDDRLLQREKGMASVQLQNVTKAWGEVVVSKDINLDIHEGEFVVFVGPSGCGKSTLLRMIAGLETITSGDLFIGEKRMNGTPPAERGVGMVFQSYALYPHLSVAENMSFGLKLAGAKKEVINQRVNQVAEVLQLAHLLDRKPKALSNLDAALRVQMRIEISRLHKRLGRTMIYVTHDQVEAMTLADKIMVLDAGRVAQVGKPLELYHYPADRFVAGFIGSPKMNFLPVKVTATAIDQVQVELPMPNRQQVWLPVESRDVQFGANMSLGIRPEHLLPSDIADVILEGEVQVVEQLGNETQIHIQIPSIRQNLVYRQNDVVLVEEGATFAIGLPPERCHLFREDGTACRRLHKEPGV